MSNNSLLEAALAYAKMDLAVIPLVPYKKTPLIRGWPDNWSKDPEQIRAWWDRWPEANIGIVCGEPSGLVVLDVDGSKGKRALRGHQLPATVVASTGRDQGSHHWFKLTTDLAFKKKPSFLENVDLQAGGSYVVAPPSVHPSGKTYEFIDFLDPMTTAPADLPDWIRRAVEPEPEKRESINEEIVHKTAKPVAGQMISPLFKTSAPKYGSLPPLTAPDRHSGQRNRWLFEKALTHFNLDLDYDYFRSIFYRYVWPGMDKGPGGDGEPFTAEEANRTIKSARECAKECGTLPYNVQRYHIYRDSKKKEKDKEYNRGPTRWSKVGLKLACMGFLCRHREREYRSGADGKECIHLLIDELNRWIEQNWPHKAPVPRTSLCRVLRELEEAGQVMRNTRRQGSGHVVFVIRLTIKNPPSVPTLRSNSLEYVHNSTSGRKTARTRRNVPVSGRHPDRDPPKPRGKPPDNSKALLECDVRTVPEYDNVEILIANAGLTLRPGERKTCHLLAWITEDKHFATWIVRRYSFEVIGMTLKHLQKHYDEINNIGGWLRTRLKRMRAAFTYDQ